MSVTRDRVETPVRLPEPGARAVPVEPTLHGAIAVERVMALQRTVGNHAVGRMIARKPAADGAVAYNQRQGFSADEVKGFQRAVGVPDDGVIGAATVTAIAKWQQRNGLTPDGRIGPATRAKLAEAGGGVPTTPAQGADQAATPDAGGAQGPVVQAAEEPGPSLLEEAGAAVGSIWETIRGIFGGGGSGSSGGGATTTPPATTPGVEPEAAQQPPPSEQVQQGSDLETLMAKERLSNEEIAHARELIAAVPDEAQRGDLYQALQAKTEYHSQRDNTSTEGGKKIGDVMCNLTSLAMCLEYLGVSNPKPEMQFEDALEEIRVKEKLPARTMADGWGGVAKTLGVKVEFIAGNPVTVGKDWYVQNVQPRLRGGDAVMASISGHIVRFQAVTEEGLMADDPYGASTLLAGEARGWDKTNKSGDSGAAGKAGEDIVWPWSAVEKHTMRWIAALHK